MAELPLYMDDRLKIEHNPTSGQEHILWLKEARGREFNYALPRGLISEFARTPRGGIESKINNFNPELIFHLRQEGINVDGLHVAICQAYAEEERRVSGFSRSGHEPPHSYGPDD